VSADRSPENAPPGTSATRFPPAVEAVMVSLAAVVVGGILMASHAPKEPPLTAPVILLAVGAVALAAGLLMLARVPGYRWDTFGRVGRWALLAYCVSAGMIEFAFVRNHTRGAPLVVVTLMLVIFALDVPVLIAGTVARYDHR